MTIEVLYFAILAEQAGARSEKVRHDGSLADLYRGLAAAHGFTLPEARVRVAVNDEFVEWGRALRDGDRVAFIPPVSGG